MFHIFIFILSYSVVYYAVQGGSAILILWIEHDYGIMMLRSCDTVNCLEF